MLSALNTTRTIAQSKSGVIGTLSHMGANRRIAVIGILAACALGGVAAIAFVLGMHAHLPVGAATQISTPSSQHVQSSRAQVPSAADSAFVNAMGRNGWAVDDLSEDVYAARMTCTFLTKGLTAQQAAYKLEDAGQYPQLKAEAIVAAAQEVYCADAGR
jgi:hypothetical protein